MLSLDQLNKTLETSLTFKACQESRALLSGSTFHLHYFVLRDLADFLDKPLTYMEIGIFNGGSLAFMLKHPNVRTYIGVDPLTLPNQLKFTEENIAKSKKDHHQIHIFKEFSTVESLPERIKSLVPAVDILFIDGAHDRKTVISDFERFHALVSKNGFIVFDDYNDFKYSPEVHGAVDEIVDRISKGVYGESSKFNIIGDPNNYTTQVFDNYPKINEFIIQILSK